MMPTGVLIPVESMSIRALIGIVHAFVRPGKGIARSSSAISFSVVIPGRHSERGRRVIVVSIIERGAGSVAVSARPTLPKTRSTSGKLAMIRSVCCKSSLAFVTETPGKAVGM